MHSLRNVMPENSQQTQPNKNRPSRVQRMTGKRTTHYSATSVLGRRSCLLNATQLNTIPPSMMTACPVI